MEHYPRLTFVPFGPVGTTPSGRVTMRAVLRFEYDGVTQSIPLTAYRDELANLSIVNGLIKNGLESAYFIYDQMIGRLEEGGTNGST